MNKIKGIIQMGPKNITEFNGKEKISFKLDNVWYNVYGDERKLKNLIPSLSTNNTVSFEHENNKVTSAIVVLEKIESPKIPESPTSNNSDMIKISGKDFMTYKGLLNKAHQKKENFSMELTESFVSEDMKRCWCKVRLTAGNRIFDGFGSSTPENTGAMTQSHPVEMAHTRAKGRALRDYLNIGEVMAEELSR